MFLRRRCFDDPPTPERISRLVSELVDADLIRRYEFDGASYGFIPRFRQRLQRTSLKHPAPPQSLVQDDEQAAEMFRRINGETKKTTVGQRMDNGSPVDCQPPEVKRREEKNTLAQNSAQAAAPRSASLVRGFDRFWAAYPRRKAKADAQKAWRALNPDEHLLGVILAAVELAKTSEEWRREEGRFIPYPAGYLRKRRWEDEAGPTAPPGIEIRHGQVRLAGGFVA
jgi:hypothetical protein